MIKLVTMLCRALAEAINNCFQEYDMETSRLMEAMARFVEKHERNGKNHRS